jgi:hypothetical protein
MFFLQALDKAGWSYTIILIHPLPDLHRFRLLHDRSHLTIRLSPNNEEKFEQDAVHNDPQAT